MSEAFETASVLETLQCQTYGGHRRRCGRETDSKTKHEVGSSNIIMCVISFCIGASRNKMFLLPVRRNADPCWCGIQKCGGLSFQHLIIGVVYYSQASLQLHTVSERENYTQEIQTRTKISQQVKSRLGIEKSKWKRM
jgi:hypothetical protein